MFRFFQRNIEKLAVKPVCMIQKSSVFCDNFAGFVLCVIICVNIPSGFRDLGNGISPLAQQLPECVGIVCLGKPAGHTDNCDWGLSRINVFRRIAAPVRFFFLTRRKTLQFGIVPVSFWLGLCHVIEILSMRNSVGHEIHLLINAHFRT